MPILHRNFLLIISTGFLMAGLLIMVPVAKAELFDIFKSGFKHSDSSGSRVKKEKGIVVITSGREHASPNCRVPGKTDNLTLYYDPQTSLGVCVDPLEENEGPFYGKRLVILVSGVDRQALLAATEIIADEDARIPKLAEIVDNTCELLSKKDGRYFDMNSNDSEHLRKIRSEL